ncbi:MAG: zinc ribbon domain-containing protein [Desulfococcus multivorans]|uniref:FmdB family zinc ribbon protein n=1 Tax=Desulfococcus sp. TaxID=2025834 RepID=UPI002A48CDC7|nr:zinc ribbon domain-containing protein [Desulfococcus multivorans]
MPIYEYECCQCCARFERIEFSGDAPANECPECHGTDVRRLISAGTVRPQGIPRGAGGFTPPQATCRKGGG